MIRGLHSFTFIDDPTRILRGIKFAVRFGFTIEEETDLLIHQAVEHGVFKELKGPRFWDELKNVLLEEKDMEAILYLEKYGILKEVSSELELNDEQWKLLGCLEGKLQRLSEDNLDEVHHSRVQRWLFVLMIIFAKLDEAERERIGVHWNLSQDQRACLQFASGEAGDLCEKLKDPNLRPSQICDLLQPLSSQQLIYLFLINDLKLVQDCLLDYSKRLKRIELEVSGKDMIDLGYKPDLHFKKVIARVKAAKLDGKVKGREEEIEWVKAYFKEKEGGTK